MTSPRSVHRPTWRTPALLGGIGLPIVVLLHSIGGLFVYVTADAGHALADADALRGHGVRQIGHAPVFPALTAIVNSVTSDLSALRVLAVIATIAMPAAFYFFVRGRSSSPFAEILGTVVFGLAPPTAEALGYFGLVMLFGIAFAIAAMRAIDDWIAAPSTRRAVIAGLFIALTAFTHTVGLVWLVQVSAIVGGIELVRLLRRPPDDRRRTFRAMLRSAPILAAFTVVSAVEGLRFVGGLDNDVRISPALDRLDLIGRFGFRSGALFWMGLLVAALIVLPVVTRGEERLRRLATWSLTAGAVAVINLVAIDAEVSYQTRQVYLLALPAAVGVVVVAARIRRFATSHTLHVSTVVLVVAATAVVVVSARAFDERLGTALPFYNHVHEDEFATLEWLRDHRGVTLVVGRAGDFYAGSEYAWMIEGLARSRAFAPATGSTNLFADQRAESDDAATFLAGATATINRGVMAAVASAGDRVQVLKHVAHAWHPVADITVYGPQPSVQIRRSARGLSITDTAGGRLFIDPRGETSSQRGNVMTVGAKDEGPVTLELIGSSEIAVDGLADTADSPAEGTFSTERLLRKHRVRWIWVWDEPSSDALSEMIDRGLSIQHREGNVVLLSVPPA